MAGQHAYITGPGGESVPLKCATASGQVSTSISPSHAWNGGHCIVCTKNYLGSHTCSASDLLRRAAELIDMANQLSQPRWLNPAAPVDRTAGCPCRPENGGSGICGCVLGGGQITC